MALHVHGNTTVVAVFVVQAGSGYRVFTCCHPSARSWENNALMCLVMLHLTREIGYPLSHS